MSYSSLRDSSPPDTSSIYGSFFTKIYDTAGQPLYFTRCRIHPALYLGQNPIVSAIFGQVFHYSHQRLSSISSHITSNTILGISSSVSLHKIVASLSTLPTISHLQFATFHFFRREKKGGMAKEHYKSERNARLRNKRYAHKRGKRALLRQENSSARW